MISLNPEHYKVRLRRSKRARYRFLRALLKTMTALVVVASTLLAVVVRGSRRSAGHTARFARNTKGFARTTRTRMLTAVRHAHQRPDL
jgi:hypothetical protein